MAASLTPMTIVELIAEIRILRMLNLDQANELEEQTLGRASKGGTVRPLRKDDAPESLGVLL